LTVQERAERIKVVLLDVDGVLTDGKISLHADGTESKQFDIKDGLAIVWARRAGLTVGFLSARTAPTTLHRASQLGVTLVHQGLPNKLETYDEIVGDMCDDDDEVAYMGDDIVDLPVLARAGLAAAPADASIDIRTRVHWVSAAKAGDGAVRELIELILRAQNRWEDIIQAYLSEAPPREHADVDPREPGRSGVASADARSRGTRK